MSNLLSQASLVMIPSGYKEDVVYSQIPTNGNGDLSFTRASNGTRVNSAGLVEVCPWNDLQYSEQIDNGVWTKFSPTSVTADTTTAPNGTTTADTISTSATSVIRQSTTLNANEIYTYSIYVKKISYDFFGFQNLVNGSGVKSVFDLSNGTVTTQGSGHTALIESVGNGWYRCSITFNAGSSASNIFDLAADGTSATLRTFYAWGAQSNIGSTAKPYFPTTDRLNVPRLTYQNGGGGCPSLLLEKQSTNLALYSEQFDNASWTMTNGTITANDIISPDGTQNADKITLNSGNSTKALFQLITLNGTYSLSWFMKYGTHRYAQILIGADIDPFANFDLQNGVLGSSANCTPKIENYGNGWYRCTMSFTTGFGGAIDIFAIDSSTAARAESSSSTGYFYAWGAQLEASSYPTSYIPTTSSSATRVIDDCRKTGISSLIGQTEGTMFIDLNLTAWDSNSFYFGLYGGGNEIYFRCAGTGAIDFVHYFGGTQAFITKSGLSLGRHKLAACYKNNDWAFYVDGILVGTDTSGTFSGTISQMVFGYTSISAYPPFQSVNQTILFLTRLTNAELASLTTI